jgi:glycerophosphoryl diester phosphodiesterase
MLIYAHRGASVDFPEGSKAAYEAAISQGADGFECDVRLTKDLQIICYHDSNIKRLTGVDLDIAKSDFAELKKVADPYLFSDLLDLAIKNKKHLAIETKHPTPTGGLIESELHKLLNQRAAELKASGINISIMSFSWFATQRIFVPALNQFIYLLRRYLLI